MSFDLFLKTLSTDGVMRVPVIREALSGNSHEVLDSDQGEATQVLESCERLVRLDWPGNPPVLEMRIAVRAAFFFYHASRLVLSRQVSAEEGGKLLDRYRVDDQTPAAHYAVDVVGRYLGDLIRLSGGELSDDLVVERLREFGACWPLSSVGVPGIKPDETSLGVVLGHPSLRAEYVDRALRMADASRLSDPRVREWARLRVDTYSQTLAPALGVALAADDEGQGRAGG